MCLHHYRYLWTELHRVQTLEREDEECPEERSHSAARSESQRHPGGWEHNTRPLSPHPTLYTVSVVPMFLGLRWNCQAQGPLSTPVNCWTRMWSSTSISPSTTMGLTPSLCTKQILNTVDGIPRHTLVKFLNLREDPDKGSVNVLAEFLIRGS